MAQRINGPVGSWQGKALNLPDDVTVIQKLLTAAATTTKNRAFDPRGVDGAIARPPRKSGTVDAIRAFLDGNLDVLVIGPYLVKNPVAA